jgi:hypothetical protein
MATLAMSKANYRRKLEGGLVLRWSTIADADGLAQLYSQVFRDGPERPLNAFIDAWTHDLMNGRHPLTSAGDFALVEDTERGVIVAATCLMSQTWEYAGIPLPVGRPEIVASDPDYRNRGLVRAVFELIHARSDERGDLAQGITGIPYYYRLFDYEYALDLGGSRSLYFASIPQLKADEQEPYRLREATLDDLPLARALYDRERAGALVSTRIDEDYWRFTFEGQSVEAGEGWRTLIITTTEATPGAAGAGQPLGYVMLRRLRWNDALGIVGLAVQPGVSLLAVLPALLRAIREEASRTPATQPDSPAANRIAFILGRDHPVYRALGEPMLTGKRIEPYAWYVRVPDLPALIRQIAPVLEQRLADSLASGHSGELKLDFYRGGLRLVFERGRLTTVEPWRAPIWNANAHAGFPPLVFLQLLFGYRSLAQLREALMDVWANDDTAPLLDVLFPQQLSWVTPLD